VARANGIKAEDVFVVDQSRQTTRISANVSGFLGTERISLNDNLLKRGSLEEIEAVLHLHPFHTVFARKVTARSECVLRTAVHRRTRTAHDKIMRITTLSLRYPICPSSKAKSRSSLLA
jgi:hypothetical protein